MDLLAFYDTFPDEASCAYLIEKRWPEGYECQHCGFKKAWYMKARRTFQARAAINRPVLPAARCFTEVKFL